MKKVFFRGTIIWFGLFILAFVNGAIRELILKQFIGEPTAHQLSCLTGVIIWTMFVWFVWKKTNIKTMPEGAVVGFYWFILTLLTETFLINRLMGKLTWEQILRTFDITHGEYWGLALFWIGILPMIVLITKKKKN